MKGSDSTRITWKVERNKESGFVMLQVLMATSTLAAGINLPARRVILRTLWQGVSNVGRAQYLQMIGRAGRAGAKGMASRGTELYFLLANTRCDRGAFI